METTRKITERQRVGLTLAVVGGFLDAYTYLTRGGVFANAQTGNVVLFCIALSEGRFRAATKSLWPILACFIGVLVAQAIKRRNFRRKVRNWHYKIIGLEMVILFGIGWMPESIPDSVVNIIVAFVAAIQVISFPKMVDTPFTSTTVTGDIRTAARNLYRGMVLPEPEERKYARTLMWRYFRVVLFFMIGAILGAYASEYFGGRAVWICCVLLMVVEGYFCWDKYLLSKKTEQDVGQLTNGE